MSRRIHYPTFIAMILICLLGFAARLWNIEVTNYDLDEGWTVVNVLFATDGYNFKQIYREPNNTLHILTVIPLAYLVPEKIGYRFGSVAAGMLTIAVVGRLGFRLFGRRAAWIAALIAALSYFVIDLSQHVRPYMQANLMAMLALLMWIEKRKRINMLFSSLTPFLHIGSFPIVMIQDGMTVWSIIRGHYVNKTEWVIRRIPPYVMLLLMLYLVHLRRLAGKVMSSGQRIPSVGALFTNWMVYTHGSDSSWSDLLFWIVAISCLIAGVVLYRQHKLSHSLWIPVLWIGLSYAILVTMTIISDGPIKFLHLSHIAFATALIFAGVLSQTPGIVRYSLLGLLIIANVWSLYDFYAHPFQAYSETYHELSEWRDDDQLIYYRTVSPVEALALATPANADLSWLVFAGVDMEKLSEESYLYLAYSNFDPEYYADTCDAEPIWRYYKFHLHECQS